MKSVFIRLFGIVFILTFNVVLAAPQEFCKLEKSDNRWFFKDPRGDLFLSKGVDHVVFDHYTIRDTEDSPYARRALAKYGSKDSWRDAQVRRLFSWGFNTIGAWSDPELTKIEVDGRRLYHTITLDFGEKYQESLKVDGAQAWLNGVFPDVFDPAFAQLCAEVADKDCRPHLQDSQLLGWFTDNELRWGPDWRSKSEILTDFLNLPIGAHGRIAAMNLLKKRYQSYEDFKQVWPNPATSWEEMETLPHFVAPFERKELYFQNQEVEREANAKDPRRAAYLADCEAFLAEAAENYFRVTTDAIRKVDPHHLIFGSRFAYVPATAVIEACVRRVDAISYNSYDEDPLKALKSYEKFQIPLMIGEFSFRARDSGLPNTKGAGPIVDTQQDRADQYTEFLKKVLTSPFLVSYHWFEFADEPREGRFDGEDSNYGVVNIQDEVYTTLTDAMQKANHRADAWARGEE